MLGRFVNLVGNSLVFPFMTIYLADRLHASMTIVGLVMALYGLSQVVAQLIGGVLSDSWGRRPVMMVSLTLGALCTLAVGLAPTPLLLIFALVLMGLSVPLFQPASMAMVGDLVPSAKLTQAYSLMRMASNAGIIIGPMIGGFLADHSFLAVFGLDALSMAIYAIIILVGIPYRRPRPVATGLKPGSIKDVVQDLPFVHFAILWGLTGMVYAQLYQVVPAYLHLDLHDPVSTFGYLAAENALLVLALQWPIARIATRFRPPVLMAAGSFCYGLGFLTMLAGRSFAVFALAVLIITIGENIINPAASTWVAQRAPEDLRGRYMGLFGLASRTGSALGPTVGGSLLTLGSGIWLSVVALGAGGVSTGFFRFG
ncbi:MFS transporter [Sulfobacillus sp. DSM 109850]|uniref:MFS transporter n=2 Tax=Sulfobacillus harzensis TaxID=2729629 RepID=A0A7Y0Q1M4_9FIRM|nr:MFS transporter [Sulfobacillus harzensis]NMP20986.1 MFS transporter [Sulfobacillus harzensis]